MKLTILPLFVRRLSVLTALLALLACAEFSPVLTPTSPPPLPSETPTILWFPPTNTPTPRPTVTLAPTEEVVPGIGSLLFEDAFDADSPWDLTPPGKAAAQVQNGSLVLSLASGPQRLLTLRREPVLTDFYAEVIATLNLCRAGDQYGMIVRASSEAYYRFVLDCNGMTRIERVRSVGTEVRQNWVASGDVPSGAPATVVIGIWASGAEMRFLLNGHLLFVLHDPHVRSGLLGFFAYAAGATPVLVSFSELRVYAVVYVSPTPSMTPTRTSTPTRSP
ncbi:MAG: hypothetical protein NZL98_04600 [Anaerolineales bacterium]|nr:hypothetical protein [Anaerolineales bacterium]MDW8226234.1 hypothetical protein [Anaerolineales bacterium]